MRPEVVTQVLNEPLAQELLHSPLLARLAYNGLDGCPRVIPIGYLWNGEQVVVCTAPNAPKVRALATNPTVALTVDTDTQPPHVLLIRGIARVEVVEGVPAEFLEASKKSITAEQWQAFELQVRALYKQMARITIVPEWAKLLDFETKLPIAVEKLVAQLDQ
ncbi:MAG: pyridoxamine 5'-phosphate oxidase family protein [Chloroflexota bacterium]|nr:pyridoxamine 5'-phosphate oxidase family protein [Chloroflexota bacterium]